MRNLLITMATLMVLSACQKDNLSNNNEASESINILNNTDIELETRNIEHSIYGRVWEDEDGDGLQDFNEPPIQNITILLRDVVTNQTIDEYVTDETGEYFFDIEVEGEFYLEIKLSAITHNYIATEPDVVPIEAIDSDVDHTFGINTSPSFEEDYNDKMDFGFYESGAIGNMVWLDYDDPTSSIGNNIFDGLDTPLEGCIVRLYSVDPFEWIEILEDTVLTDANGNYLFENLKAGIYFLEIVANPNNLNLTNSYMFCNPNVGDNEDRDSDIIEILNTTTQNTLRGRTALIDLRAGETNLETDIGIRDNSAVICFFPPGGFGTSVAGGGGSASPNGTVWIDTNADGFMKGGEPTMEGVTVDLINSENDSIIQTVITDDNGYYEFDRINNRIANCYLQISQPRGYMLSKNVSGSCYPTSDFDQKTRKTATFRTSACPYYSSYDAGLVEGIFILGRKE